MVDSQVLLYLLRRCYGLCYRLMASSEPISEELMPIANVRSSLSSLFALTNPFCTRKQKLTTVKRCLSESHYLRDENLD